MIPEEQLVTRGKVRAIYIASERQAPMQKLASVEAIAGQGLAGDRYTKGQGSFNHKEGVGKRQVTLMNGRFFKGTPFLYSDSRRNIITEGVELLWLIDQQKLFRIGTAWFKTIEYLEPCDVPSNLAGKSDVSFKDTFMDCGAIVAEIVETGIISVYDNVFHERKKYEKN